MTSLHERDYIRRCLHHLAIEIGPRPAGSAANRQAADFIASEMEKAEYEVARQEYPCPDWQAESGELIIAGEKVEVTVNRFSRSCQATAELVPVDSLDRLRSRDITDKIAVLHGELTNASFFPKNFDYIRDEAQDQAIALLEGKRPQAIIAVSHNEIPHPGIIEDSDFAIPSVTVSRQDEARVLSHAGEKASLKISSLMRESTGANLIGKRPGNSDKKVIICAHYDSYHGSPGALDNGAGIATLLLLAWKLKERKPQHSIELVAFGGEDSWYPGDALYMKKFTPDNVAIVMNIDGIGMQGSNTTIAFFNVPAPQEERIMNLAGKDFVSEPFYESDHGFFWPLGIPTIAFATSALITDLLGTVIHTANDTPDIVDDLIIKRVARLTHDIICMLD